MSLYGKCRKVGGLWAGPVMRGTSNGEYTVLYEREFASLEQIEAVDWARLTVEGEETVLPRGYGYQVVRIDYESNLRSYRVTLRVAEQFLGDVTGYQAQVKELEGTVSEQAGVIQARDETIQQQETAIKALEEEISRKEESIRSLKSTVERQTAQLQTAGA